MSEPTCFKGETPTLLDIFLTNKPKSFCHCINVDTGISDFHNLTGIVTRAHAPQSERRVLTYRSMKHFQHNEFSKDVGFIPFHVCEIFDEVDDILWAQQQLFSSVINALAPLKRRRIRRRQVPYMNGPLRKIIHQRNMWRNRHFKDKRNTTARSKYIFFRNQATKLMKSSVNTYFTKKCENRDSNKKFYKTVKPFLSDKSSCGNNKIILKENDKIVSDPPEVADIFNAFYGSIADYPADNYDGLDSISMKDVIDKHCNHPSITSIKTYTGAQNSKFEFQKITTDNVTKLIKSLNAGKSPGYDGIQDKYIKLAGDNLSQSLSVLFNKCVESCIFPAGMKMADICPVYKKLDSLCKDNYRSVNLLIVFSKLFEWIMAEQLTIYFENILSTRVSAYRRGYSCQHVILNLTEYWRKALDDNHNVGTIGMDLSKAFDCMPHGLLLAKLFAYGVAPNACLFISTYLKNLMQRVKIMGTSSDWATINRGVPQGSVLGPLLFNIFLNDLFYLPLNSALVNYTDDNHLCNSNKNLDVLQKELESDCARAVQWFTENQTTANSGKFQSILLSRHNIETFNINIGDHIISRNNTLKILGITLDEKLNFNEHIRNICQTSSRQINALRRISKFLNQQCREKVYKSFINANFGYCPLEWMLCGKCNLRKIEKLQERALRIVYQDSELDYASLIGKSGQSSLRMNMIRILSIEIYKCVKGTNPDYLNEMFSLSNSHYDLRDQSRLEQPKFNTKTFGYRSFKYLGAKLWNLLPYHLKSIDDLHVFKSNLHKWCLTEKAHKILAQMDL